MLGLAGRRALVTGAGSGIGRATVTRLRSLGAAVVGLDRARPSLHDPDLSDIEWVPADVSTDAALAALESSLPVDILVNAAGILRRHSLIDHPLDDWNETLAVDLRGPFRLTRNFAAALIARSAPGAVVNVCSIESFITLPAHAAYTAAKAGLLMLTRSFAHDLAPHRIRVNGVAPGVTATRMNEDVRADPIRSKELISSIPLGRIADPSEVAAAIAFLASDDASYVTGAILPVDGGWLTH